MDEPEWVFSKDKRPGLHWYWLCHTRCSHSEQGTMIWSSMCDCGARVPKNIILQAKLLSDDFAEWYTENETA